MIIDENMWNKTICRHLDINNNKTTGIISQVLDWFHIIMLFYMPVIETLVY